MVLLTCLTGAIVALPASAQAANTYVTYVGCSVESEVPSHLCPFGVSPGAYFESPEAEVEYEVCVVFPAGEELCAEEQEAEEGILYVNEITTEVPGKHVVTWYVEGVEVGTWTFTISEPPPPPPPPTITTTAPAPQPAPAPAPVVTPPPPSAACLSAEGHVKKLKKKLAVAKSPKAKWALRKALRKARAAARGAC